MYFFKIISMFGLSLLSSHAYAQHGSVNGPALSGRLNPQNGTHAIDHDEFGRAVDQCYGSMLKDMLDPFLDISHMDPNDITLTGTTGPIDFDFTTLLFDAGYLTIDLKNNHTPYAEFLKKKSSLPLTLRLFTSGRLLSGSTETGESAARRRADNFGSSPEFYSALTFLRGKTQFAALAGTGLPVIRYSSVSHEEDVLDPFTHLVTGSRSVLDSSKLAKSYIGPSESSPSDVTQITLKNVSDLTDSNFKINGAKFFKCVESNL